MKDVREILKKRPLLFDGGMGTYYKAKPGQECEQANLLDPDGILTVHRAYLEAGADAIKTNTFGLPRMAAAQNPMWEAMADEGWKLAAQAAAKTSAAVFADLGPAPDTEALPAAQIYTALAERFVALGAKNFLFETLSSDAGVAEAAKKIKETVPDAFVLVSFAVLPDGYTREGRHCAELVRSMTACGAVDAVGLNCVSAPGAMRALVQQLGETKLPLAVMPNAGYPVVTRTRVQYQGKPEYFARELARLAAEGVRILGGCCGTTPAHIAALRAALDALPETLPAAPAVSTAAKPEVEKDDAFLRKLNAGKKVIAIELDSPKDADLTGYLDGARRLQAAGADLLTIADCPIARARMDSSLVACRVQAADAISAARPGARRENLENYIKRLQKLEEITSSYPGVEKSYAIQAGREVRVMVKPEQVNEDQMVILARELAKRIENELEYPGQIKVHVLRETKVVEYAK